MQQQASLATRSIQLFVVGTGGSALAVVVAWLLQQELRYAAAGIMGLLLVAAGLVLSRHLPDVLLTALAFNLPFTGIEKTFFLQNETTFVAGGISIGFAEMCLAGLYTLWFGRIFITQSQSLPKLRFLDWCVFAFWFAHVLSLYQAYSQALVVVEVARAAKYALVYFYIAHNLQRRHLKWLATGVFCALLLQTGLAVVQYKTGKLLGVGQTKGAAGKNYDQYTIDGFENVKRAEGTTFDSHALGLFCAMGLTIPFALVMTRRLHPGIRLLSGAVFLIGLQALIISFARAGWTAFACAAGLILVYVLRGQYKDSWKQLIPIASLAILLAGAASLPLVNRVRQRIVDAPKELLTARVDTVEMALEMWRPRSLTGIGANNSMRALEIHFSIFEGDPLFIPAHNMFVFILVELGLLGFATFVVFSYGVVRSGRRASKTTDPLRQSFAAALLGSFLALQVEGIFDPIYVTNVTYFFVWFQVGIIGGLDRLACNQEDAPVSPSNAWPPGRHTAIFRPLES